MNKITLCVLASSLAISGYAQKKPLDHTVYDGWQSTANTQLSEKGTFATYVIKPQEGDASLVIKNLKNNKSLNIDRANTYTITPNEKYVLGKIRPTFAQAKEQKKKKGKKDNAPSDSLFIANLSKLSYENKGAISSFKIGTKGSEFFAYVPKDKVYTTDSVKIYKPLLVSKLGTQWVDTLKNVDQYYFNEPGNQLALLIKPDKKDTINTKQEFILYDLENNTQKTLSEGFFKYQAPTFNKQGNQIAFLASKDSVLPTDRNFNLYRYEVGQDACEVLIDTNYTKGLPANWHFTSNSRIHFSENSEKLFASVAPLTLPQDTVKIEDEQAVLDIWHYQDPTVQPHQLLNRNTDLARTYSGVINLKNDPHKLVLLTTNKFESLSSVDKGDADFALIYDKNPYMIATQWSVSTGTDIYKIDVNTGKKELLFENFIGTSRVSPKGKFLLLYNKEDLNWYSYNILDKVLTNLTGDLKINFWDEKNDNPSEPYPYGVGGWTANDDAVLLYDAFDIWSFDLNKGGKASCLTNGNGRKNGYRYRIIDTDSEKKFFDKKENLLLSFFNTKNKDEALATIKVGEVKNPKNLLKQAPYMYDVKAKAKDNNIYLYSKSNFDTNPDLLVTKNDWKSSTQLTNINPQMAEYNWGTVELVDWTAYSGDKMEGLLYKPEDFDPNKKYPMMIYFYETHSDELNQYYSPSPSWSIINIPFYVSRGYLVFCPDTHYTTGLPGESAYNCIVSGAEAMAKNSWVDEKNMAIQGQSWGGYQVAYLVTRTNMFKAAGAGAPVSNMTSAYGGIRWSTGTSRQLQYEMGQSRIGSTLWDSPELYIANSPLFKVNRIETPLLIMHNDDDGAVPWYQGIELFMAMRRLQKPVWMLQYNQEAHNLIRRENRKDLSIRLQQFFDHYLKGDPMPEWMKHGVPATRKGKTMGYELTK